MQWLSKLYHAAWDKFIARDKILAANESQDWGELVVANEALNPESTKENWVMLAPYGSHPNVKGLQKFDRLSANAIVTHWNSLPNRGVKVLGLPWYIGHPDIPEYRDRYRDTGAVGRITDLQAREDGLFANVEWNDDGKNLIRGKKYHGHSVAWYMKRSGSEWSPFALRSVGFTNEPNIPVPPITAANETNPMNEEQRKALAKTFGLPESATIEQIVEAAGTKVIANEEMMDCPMELKKTKDALEAMSKDRAAAGEKMAANEKEIAELREGNKKLTDQVVAVQKEKDAAIALVANERKLRAEPILKKALDEGRITPKDRDEIESLFVNESWEAGEAKLGTFQKNSRMHTESGVDANGRRAERSTQIRNKTQEGVVFVNELISKNPNLDFNSAFTQARKERPELFANPS